MDGGSNQRMAPHKTYFSAKLPRLVRDWVRAEADRLGVTSSDVLRGALHLLRAQPAEVRRRAVDEAARDEEAGSGQDQRA